MWVLACVREVPGVKKVGCVVVIGGLALVLLCNLAPGLVQQLQASPMGALFAKPFIPTRGNEFWQSSFS